MTREKKFFAPVLRDYGKDLTKRWRIEYKEATHNGANLQRRVFYGTINSLDTIEGREQIAADIIKHLDRYVCKPDALHLLDRVCDAYKIHWRDKTFSSYMTVAQSFKEWSAKHRISDAPKAETVSRFLFDLYETGKSKNTVAKYRNTLFSLYEKAVALGYAKDNPVQKVPQIKREPQSLYFFSDAQILQFKCAAADGIVCQQLWLAIRMLFYCVIRPGEQRLLRLDAINWEFGYIEIPGQISKNGKTQKVSIPETFLSEIQYLRDYPATYFMLSKGGTPGRDPISAKWLNDEHAKILNALKIRGRYAFYSWKHTAAVKAVRAGVNLKDLQLQFRHHSLDMLNEYLKGLGVMMSQDLKNRYPTL